MKKTIYTLTLVILTFYSCSSDDNSSPSTEDPKNQCEQPTEQYVTGITTTSARLVWRGPTRDFFQVEYGPNGFTQGTGTTENSNENDLSVNGLSPDTPYDFYVRGNCGGSEFSDWAGPYSFVTD